MKKEKERKDFIEAPTYPGGEKALTDFIYQHLRYPQLAAEAGVEGTVYLEYDIDYQGNVVDTRLLQGIGHGCDEEAQRVVRLLKFNTSRYRGVKVVFHRKAKIHFRPAKAAPAASQPQLSLQYSIVPTEPQPSDAPVEQERVFSYTIQF